MSRATPSQVFLHRANYRQRRLRDAAKLLPVVGILLWAIPLTWPAASENHQANIGSAGLLYVFGVWVLLIVLAAALTSRMRPNPETPQGEGAEKE
ncbi:hypothetical protein [Loktanella sp. Alg231-35]|uniref:hypothetical protein n=1 Tax=Loktanella sp. Alg231-35 TaxID=1922220 RepID=UPI000D54D4C5|nr:hypothetical protein [Loktanella sp. Alg231-35]